VSHVFGLGKDKVTVRNPFVGGAFGSGLRPQYQLILAMMASLHLKRSVRVVLTRQQMFTFGHRPETWQRVKLAAERDGTLRAIVHEAVAETSRWRTTWRWWSTGRASSTLRQRALDYKLVDARPVQPDRHARARRGARRACARGGDGRAGPRAAAWTRWRCA
jgi:CO/xanthine dehydrogenase Mo-binding subunit